MKDVKDTLQGKASEAKEKKSQAERKFPDNVNDEDTAKDGQLLFSCDFESKEDSCSIK